MTKRVPAISITPRSAANAINRAMAKNKQFALDMTQKHHIQSNVTPTMVAERILPGYFNPDGQLKSVVSVRFAKSLENRKLPISTPFDAFIKANAL